MRINLENPRSTPNLNIHLINPVMPMPNIVLMLMFFFLFDLTKLHLSLLLFVENEFEFI